MQKNILIVGECGVGKTWVMIQLVKRLNALERAKIGKFKFHFNDERKVMMIGVYDGSTFAGSDRLSMSIMTDLELFTVATKEFSTICEGDRFMNKTYINAVNPIIIKIVGDGEAGRIKRGSQQTDRQLKSIKTRVGKIDPDHTVGSSAECIDFVLSLIEINE